MTDQTPSGPRLIKGNQWGTALFVATAVPAAVMPDWFRVPAILVALALFAIGCVTFLVAYAIAISRSRTDAIGIGGLFFLAGSAPTAVRRTMMVALGVQVVVALATASARPFTSLAFGILAPMFGLGMSGLWGARYGHFDERATE